MKSTWRKEFRDFLGSVISMPADYFAGWFGVAPAESGVEVNELTAMQIAAYVGCVRIISGAIATLPFRVWASQKGEDRMAPDHPLDDVLNNQPNPETTAADFWQTVGVHLLLTGNAYAEKAYNGAGEVAALYLRSPFRTIPYRRANGQLFYKTNETPTGYEREIEASEMCHFRNMGLDSLVGLSPVKYYAREVLGSDLAAQSYSSKFFANNAAPGGFLTHSTHMAKEKKLEAAQAWQQAHSRGNAHSVAILDGGMDWKSVTIPPEQAQFLQTRKFNREQIAAIFGVPVHFLGESVESRANMEQRGLEFLTYTIKPYLAKIEQAINMRLFPSAQRKQSKFYARFDVTMFERATYADLLKGVQMGRYAGLYTVNEGRKELGLQPYSDEQEQSDDPADKLWMPVNMVPLDTSGEVEAGSGKKPQGAGGNDQGGGDGAGTGKPPRQTGQGGKRDREIERYFRLFYKVFDEAVGKSISRKKNKRQSGIESEVIFRPVLTLIASTFSFRADAEPGEMILPEAAVEFINQYMTSLAQRSEGWTEKNREEISAKELRQALEAFREACTPAEESEAVSQSEDD